MSITEKRGLMGGTWEDVKKGVTDCLTRFFNGDEKFKERRSIQECVGKLERIVGRLDTLKRSKQYCSNNAIRNIINNHISDIHIIIKSIQLQESSLREKTNERDLLRDLRKSLDKPLINANEALEKVERGEFNFSEKNDAREGSPSSVK